MAAGVVRVGSLQRFNAAAFVTSLVRHFEGDRKGRDGQGDKPVLPVFDPIDLIEIDPLAPRPRIERACGWAFESRRQLTARGGSPGGSGRQSSGRRRQTAAQQRARALAAEQRAAIRGPLATMRDLVRENEKRARASTRALAKAEAELRYQGKVFNRTAFAQQRALVKQLKQQVKADNRAVAQSRAVWRKIGALVRSAPAKRTPYQRRVLSGLAGQARRGEPLSIRRATHKPLPTSPTALRQRAVERILATYGDHPNFDRSTVETNLRNLDRYPRILEHIIRADESELSSIAAIQTVDHKTGQPTPLNIERLRVRLHAIDASYDELRSFNPLWYH